MSLYEVLVIVALVVAGGFAFRLYRKDMRGTAEGRPPPASTGRMFERPKPGDDRK